MAKELVFKAFLYPRASESTYTRARPTPLRNLSHVFFLKHTKLSKSHPATGNRLHKNREERHCSQGTLAVTAGRRGAIGMVGVEVRDATKHPVMHGAPHNKEFSGPKDHG